MQKILAARLIRQVAAFCLLFLLRPITGWAIAAQDSPSLLEEVVVTAAKIDQTIADVGTNIDRITDLDGIGQTHINETLQRTPGVWISRGNGQEHLTAIRSPVLTGAGACGAFLMAQDNLPLRASGFCNVNALFDVNSEQAARIEVVKGPAGVLYGSNAMHGMINVITPPLDEHSSISAEAGPHDYYRTKITAGTSRWRLDVNHTTDGGYKHDSGFDQQKANFKFSAALLGFELTNVLSISNLNQETAGFIFGNKAYKDSHLARQNPNPEAYRDSSSIRLYSIMTKSLNHSELVLTPYVRHTRMEFIQHFLPGQAIEKNGHESVGLQTAWHFKNWLIGAEFEFTEGFLQETQPNTTNSDSAFLVATIPQGDHYDYDVDARTLALFSQYTKSMGSNSKLTLAARYEQVKYDYANNLSTGRSRADGSLCGFGGCRFNRPANRSDSFSNFSPQLNFSHYLTSTQQLYLQLARGYRAPQTTELYRLQGGQTVSEIDSEQLDSLEIGFRGSVPDFINNNRLNYDLSLYQLKKDNFIFRDSNRASVDNGKTSHTGLEINLSVALSNTISTDWVMTYARHQYENNPAFSAQTATSIMHNDIDTAPRKLGSIRLTWQPAQPLTTELELVYLGKYYTDPENNHSYPGHTIINLRSHYNINNKSQIFIRLINLTNKKYAERADFAFGSERYFVGEPASIYVGIKMTL